MSYSKAMGKKRSPVDFIRYNSGGETRLYLFLAFLIPFLIIWGLFVFTEIHPFGDKQILVTDLWHQYFPFFREEQSKLQDGGSLLYSWNTGLGTNFLSIMSYYAASPLNFLSVLFPIEYSRDALTLFLTIKIGCSGLFFAIFLKNVFNRNDISLVGFGLGYALCNYMMGYYWNLIWMDTFALLPLVVLGTVMLVKKGRYKLYVISLALSLISNFYIGLFTCIFTAMVYFASVIIYGKGAKNILRSFLKIAGATVIALGMSAFMLLPAYFALQLSYSANNTFPTIMEFYEDWFKMLSNMIGFHEPTAKEGLPNFYCGMFSIVLFGVFMVNRKIKIREKIIAGLFLAFIVVSCNMNILNYIWHGFHFTNMIPYRFSFLFSFILLTAAYRAFTVIAEKSDIFDIISMAIMACSVALISYNNQEEKAVLYSVIACFVYIAVMFVYHFGLINRKTMNIAVVTVCTAEMGWNAYIGVNTVSNSTYSVYPNNEKQVQTLLDARAPEEEEFYRTEFKTTYTLNDCALNGVKGMSQFSSIANVNVTKLLGELGVQASEAGNRYYYTEGTPVINSFFNIRYLITHNGRPGNETYFTQCPVIPDGGCRMYENNALLPVAFAADNALLSYKGMSSEQGENQNELFRKAVGLGASEDVLVRLPVKDVGHKNLNVVKTSEGCYNFQYSPPADGGEECYLKYNYEVPATGPVFIMIKFGDVEEFDIIYSENCTKNITNQKYKNIAAVGEFTQGDVISVKCDLKKDTSGTGEIYVYQIDEERFRKGIEKLSEGGLDITSYDDTTIEGEFTASEDGVMFTSIPYDGGWSAYVDGEYVEIESLKNALNLIPVKKGKHTLKLKYSPPGFDAGFIISVASILVFAALWVVERKYRKNHPESAEEASAETMAEAAENSEGEEKGPLGKSGFSEPVENGGAPSESSGFSGLDPLKKTETEPDRKENASSDKTSEACGSNSEEEKSDKQEDNSPQETDGENA